MPQTIRASLAETQLSVTGWMGPLVHEAAVSDVRCQVLSRRDFDPSEPIPRGLDSFLKNLAD